MTHNITMTIKFQILLEL